MPVPRSTNKVKFQVTEQQAQFTKAQLEAAQREQKILELPRLRRPIRKQEWFQESWQNHPLPAWPGQLGCSEEEGLNTVV